MAGMIDLEDERQRLGKEIEISQAEIARSESKLKDTSFLSRAPPEVVERERQKLRQGQERLETIRKRLADLG